MTLKEELEILRGTPIKVFDGDPLSIPCIETSDVVQLCKHPVVSVHMLTYNHEPYIRQAIEGVMAQKTDFEFELVIGEDCSKDKTREICFEYQKKYPDKIRVLWWHENVSKYGGNLRRITAHCRGEFIAFCEGDDYWIDPLKLQKQVDAMRKYPNVGLCFCDAKLYWQCEDRYELWKCNAFDSGVIPGKRFLLFHLFGVNPGLPPGNEGFIMTATVMIRTKYYYEASSRYEVFNWMLYLGDKVFWYGISSLSDAFYLNDEVAVYRRVPTGMMSTMSAHVFRDSALLRMYYPIVVFGISAYSLPAFVLSQYLCGFLCFKSLKSRLILKSLLGVFRTRFIVLLFRRSFLMHWLLLVNLLAERLIEKLLGSQRRWRVPSRILKLYKQYGAS